jgi:hypothetical protein
MNDENIAALKQAAIAATPQEIDSAQRIEHYEDGSHVECPTCGGEGHVELEADYCNYDGTAIGVQFYGVGREHGSAEAYLRAAKPANVLALIERVEKSQWQPIETAPKDGRMFLGWVSAIQYGESDDGSPYETDVSDHDFCQWRDLPDGGYFENMMGKVGDASHITHWMPLPAAPTP